MSLYIPPQRQEKDEMRSFHSSSAAAIVAALMCGPTASNASESSSGWYGGAEAGHAEISVNASLIGDRSLTDTALSAFGGYRFSRHLAVEGRIADLGDYQYFIAPDCPGACVPLFPAETQHSIARLDLSLIGTVPLGERWQAYARLGLASTRVETVSECSALNPRQCVSIPPRSKESEFSAVYGLGLRASFNDSWSMRLQWDRSPGVGDRDLDANVFWLGGEYQFGGRTYP